MAAFSSRNSSLLHLPSLHGSSQALHWLFLLPRRCQSPPDLILSCFSIPTSPSYDCCCCSVSKSCPMLCNPMNCSMPGFPVLHYLPEFAQTHVPKVGDAIQPSHPPSSRFPPALNLSQHQGLFQSVSSLHQVVIVLEVQLQHQSFQ